MSIAPKWLKINQDNRHAKFVAQNVDYNRMRFDFLCSRNPAYEGVKVRVAFQNALLLYCTDSLAGIAPIMSRVT